MPDEYEDEQQEQSESEQAKEWAEFLAFKESRRAVAERVSAQTDVIAGIRGARNEQELTDYLHAQDQAGNLMGREHESRFVGTGVAPTEGEIKACRTTEQLDALMYERFGNRTASEMGVGRGAEL